MELLASRLAVYTVNDFILPRGSLPEPTQQERESTNWMVRKAAEVRDIQRAIREQFGYDGITTSRPLYPVQVNPEDEMQNQNRPFMRYFTSTVTNPEFWHVMRDETTYIISDNNLDRANLITNLMRMLLSRKDETAYDINQMVYSAAYNASAERRIHNFLTFEHAETLSPEPPTQEGGRLEKNITFVYSYNLNTVFSHPD